mmetsp:Transcript_21155/g.60388  ORF Transcript_21155/g.60388 Transcript_21155/m.60388 type:complete len:351 (-) Transcript_21155:62-1114(-)
MIPLSPIPQSKTPFVDHGPPCCGSGLLSPTPTTRKTATQQPHDQHDRRRDGYHRKSTIDDMTDTASTYGNADVNPSTAHKKKVVRFSTITVYEMPVVLGDNPSVSSGCPITIDWKPQRRSWIPLEHFEAHRPRRRCTKQLRLSARGRRTILLRAGHTASELHSSMANARTIQKQRMASYYRQRCIPGMMLGLTSQMKRHQRRLNAQQDNGSDVDSDGNDSSKGDKLIDSGVVEVASSDQQPPTSSRKDQSHAQNTERSVASVATSASSFSAPIAMKAPTSGEATNTASDSKRMLVKNRERERSCAGRRSRRSAACQHGNDSAAFRRDGHDHQRQRQQHRLRVASVHPLYN